MNLAGLGSDKDYVDNGIWSERMMKPCMVEYEETMDIF